MSQTKTQLVEGLNINTSAPATALQIDASGNINLDSNTLYVDATNNRVGLGSSIPSSKLTVALSQADSPSSSDTTLANSFLHLGQGEYGSGRYYLTTYGYSTGRTNSGAYVGALGTSSTGYGKYDLVFGTRDVTTDTAPTERLRITSAGLVGIGTSSPAETLDVNGFVRIGTDKGIKFDTSASANDVQLVVDSNADLQFKRTNGLSSVTIQNAGNVGIGTSSPGAALDVSGNGNLVRFGDGTNTFDVRFKGPNNWDVQLDTSADKFNIRRNSSSLVTVDGAGRVGIGTTSPSYALDINGSQGVGLQIFENSSGNNRRLRITQESSGVTYDATYSLNGNAHRWLIGGGEAARITANGQFLVGTSSASSSSIYNLTTVVSGNVKLGACLTVGRTGGDYDGVGYNVAWQASSGYKYEVSDTAAYIKFGSSGRVETFTAPFGTGGSGITFTAGPYVAQGGTSWTSSSDERLKEDLLPIENALNKTNALRAVTGKFKTDPVEKRRAFLIAQDVQAILPEAVDSTNSESLGLDYSAIIPLLVAALKESKERIETLEAEVAALKGA